MTEKKPDRRALKTKKAIREGLAELIAEKELRHITVQELSDRVDIHRVTFYKHYMDVYDVYEQIEKNVIDEIERIIREYSETPAFEFYPLMFQYMEENPKIFRMIFSPNTTAHLRVKITELIENLCRNVWSSHGNISGDDPTLECVIHYHSIGCMAIIAGWVLSDFKQSRDFIVKTISDLDQHTEKYILSLKKN